MPFDEDGMTNLFDVNNLTLQGFRVCMDSDIEIAFLVRKMALSENSLQAQVVCIFTTSGMTIFVLKIKE